MLQRIVDTYADEIKEDKKVEDDVDERPEAEKERVCAPLLLRPGFQHLHLCRARRGDD